MTDNEYIARTKGINKRYLKQLRDNILMWVAYSLVNLVFIILLIWSSEGFTFGAGLVTGNFLHSISNFLFAWDKFKFEKEILRIEEYLNNEIS